ncbi:MAG: hypothetical protein QOJ72_459 [Nocardioidaceae bacterium]|nr:hypothetical protein [Nocardioidaceae bacterium]
MISLRKLASTGLVTMLAVSASALSATAATVSPAYAYAVTAGGTQITAVGTTITSSATAQSALFGLKPGTQTNKVASVKAGALASIGAVNTDVTATAQGDGFKLNAHARTANVSLLGGVIKIQAVDTTSAVAADDDSTPTANTSTELIGLVIAGKKYPINVAPNTSVTIPGVASVTINAETSAINGKVAGSTGAGLVVTLLAPRAGAAAGASIVLNPTFAAVQPSKPGNPDAPSLGGTTFGAYVEAHATEQVKAETGRLPLVNMPLVGTNGKTLNNHIAKVNVPGVLNLGALDASATGITTAGYAKSETSTKIANLNLFNGLITATAIGSTSTAEMVDKTFTEDGSLQFINLKIAGKAIPIDIGPNTTIKIANLGTVTVNEQTSVAIAGRVHGFQVVGLHITLDTARAGLPIGAEIQIATSQALIWK